MSEDLKTPTPQAVASAVDHLGNLKARIADLETVANYDKSVIIEAAAMCNLRAFEGEMFRATVSFNGRTTTDWSKLFHDVVEGSTPKEKERISQLLIKHTHTSEGVPSVRVTARKTEGA
jgi:hypothetical protein